ncbi:hypothetical protein Tco_0233263 [Tanacetum coccineum]
MLGNTLGYLRMDVYRSVWVVEKLLWIWLGALLIDSPRAVTFRDKYGVQMIMRFNEIYEFNDGNLQQIDEALDYRVKEFRVNRMNLGLDIRFWMKKDIDRSKEFTFEI